MEQYTPPARKLATKNRIQPEAIRLQNLPIRSLTLFIAACLSSPLKADHGQAHLPDNIMDGRNLLGETANTIGNTLDSLFGAPDKNQINDSVLILRSGIYLDDKNEASLFGEVSFRADLPSTEEKLQLLVRAQKEDNYGDNDNTSVHDRGDSRSSEQFIRSSKAGIYFRYIHQKETSPWQTIIDTGFAFDNTDAEPVSTLRVRKSYQFANGWQVRPEPTIFWSHKNDFAVGLGLHSQKWLSDTLLLKNSTNFGVYLTPEKGYYNHGWQLSNRLSDDLRVSYNLSFYSHDDIDDPVDTVEISANLRRRIHENWLFFSVIPADKHSSDNDYKRDLSLTLQLEAKFGSQY